MGQWHRPIVGLPPGKVFWYEDPALEDEVSAMADRRILFVFLLAADQNQRPNKPWEVLKGNLERLDEMVLKREGIRSLLDARGWLWISHEDEPRFRSVMAQTYGNALRVIDLVAGVTALIEIPTSPH